MLYITKPSHLKILIYLALELIYIFLISFKKVPILVSNNFFEFFAYCYSMEIINDRNRQILMLLNLMTGALEIITNLSQIQ